MASSKSTEAISATFLDYVNAFQALQPTDVGRLWRQRFTIPMSCSGPLDRSAIPQIKSENDRLEFNSVLFGSSSLARYELIRTQVVCTSDTPHRFPSLALGAPSDR